METIQNVGPVKIGTHPLVTLFVFFVIVAAIVFCGSYSSHQRSVARATQATELEANAAATAVER